MCKSSINGECAEKLDIDIKCNGTPQEKADCWRWSGGLKPQTWIQEKK